MKMLIIESEEELRATLARQFRQEGYVCETARDYREAYLKIVDHDYDFVLIDLKLVGLLWDEHKKPGVIILSSRQSLADKVAGLELGADDYLTKPFHLAELRARVKAVMRRKADDNGRELRLGQLTIRLSEREALAGDQSLCLTKKEFDILVYLARNKNRVVAKDHIAEHLWGDHMEESVSFDFIYAHVKNLRKKLAGGGCGNYLKTVYGVGYKLVSS
jgi:DNA-binding response OmpR family regulator